MNRKLASAISVLFFILAIGGATLIGADPYAAIAAQEPQATHTVYITDAGPNPVELDVMVGDTVTWINQTDQEQVIEGTTGAKVFLPLILRSAIAATASEQSGEYLQAVSLEPAADTWGGNIPPGGSYTRAFGGDGFYPYELPVHPGWGGIVRVRRIPPPLLTAHSHRYGYRDRYTCPAPRRQQRQQPQPPREHRLRLPRPLQPGLQPAPRPAPPR